MKSKKEVSITSEAGPKVVQLRVELLHTKPLVWRRIHLLANSSLRTLQYAINETMEWNFTHLYCFKISEDVYSDPEFDQDFEGWLDDSKINIGRIAKDFSEFEYIYDFGDDWHHRIIIEEILSANPTMRYPVCMAGENAAPPEDCGGPPGFEEYKKSTSTMKAKRPTCAVEAFEFQRQQSTFDPSFFDLKIINDIKLSRRRISPSATKTKAFMKVAKKAFKKHKDAMDKLK